MAKVYFTKDISAEGLKKAFHALGVTLKGNVGVKISTGEPGGHNFLQPAFIAPFVQDLNGTSVECNTAYAGRRNTTQEHWKAIREHGFDTIAPCDIMDEEGEMAIAVPSGKHLKENFVGSHLTRYQSMLMLSHFKGHAMAGLGGALKNMSIGVASSHGKLEIHTGGKGGTSFKDAFQTDQDVFLESMADADASVMAYLGKENIVYINVANRLSVDCDCDSNPHEPEMADIGIFASLDPVAVDQASVDAVYQSPDEGKAALIERMESRHGIHVIEAAEALGLGSRTYELISLD